MKISELSIRRPVLAIVMNIILVLIGVVSYDRLSVREYPNTDVPVVTVTTKYPGASAEIMESQVARPLEDALSGIEGIDYIKSISRSESSQISVQFKLDRQADAAASDVRDRVGRARGQLPEEIEEPVIAKTEADANPIIWLSLNSETANQLEVSDIADRIVQDRLQILPGVANVNLFAERRYSMRVWLDRARMAAYQITTSDVEGAIRSQNVEIPAGRIESIEREFTVLTETDLNTPEEFSRIILRNGEGGVVVRLGDVAKIELGAVEERSIVRFNNKSSIGIGIVKQSTANPLDVSKAVRKELPAIQSILPEGLHLEVAYDTAVFIDESISSVFHTIMEAIVLVVAVIFFFLRSGRATLIPLVTIPISLIVSFALMYTLGFSINTLTMLAFVLAIGLVVDDAIVVLENVYRHIENGDKPIQAAVKASREIGFAVVAMTLTLAAVFAPVAFSPGKTGKLFIEFALTLAGAVIVSGFTALTLTPMMCSRLLRHEHAKPQSLGSRIEKKIKNLENNYSKTLARIIGWRKAILLLAGLVGLSCFGMISHLPSELAPTEDRGVIFAMGIAPEGATPEFTDKYAHAMEKILQAVPEGEWNFMAVGFPIVTQSFSVLGLKPWEDRDRSASEIIQEISPKLFGGIPGIMAFSFNPPSLGQRGISKPVDFILQTTGSYEELNVILDRLLMETMQNKGIQNPDTDLKLNKPELRIEVNRDKLANLGVKVDDVGKTLSTMLSNRRINKFKRDGELYDVMVQVADVDRQDPADITSIYVRGRDQMIPLSNLVKVEETVAPRELNHFNKLRSASLTATLAPGYSLGDALKFLEQKTREISNNVQIDFGGNSREFKESSSSLAFIMSLALIFIYLVLAAQFESFIDPLIILLSVPLAIAGALLAMTLTGGSMNLYSQIGLVALVGLIAKNGIMIVEFANQLQDHGRSKIEAVVEAASIRLRPIMMTTAATIFGAIPLIIAGGAGSETRSAIGWVIVGGMSIGTLMTLFMVPTAYVLLNRKRRIMTQQEIDII